MSELHVKEQWQLLYSSAKLCHALVTKLRCFNSLRHTQGFELVKSVKMTWTMARVAGTSRPLGLRKQVLIDRSAPPMRTRRNRPLGLVLTCCAEYGQPGTADSSASQPRLTNPNRERANDTADLPSYKGRFVTLPYFSTAASGPRYAA